MTTTAKCPYQMLDEQGHAFTPPSYPLRADIPTPPARMAHLPIDERGYPVPFFVAWPEMKPEFRAAASGAFQACMTRNLCWVCGTPLGNERVFTIGPMCSVNRVSSEPPAHIACARYSVKACPFLNKPQMVRRTAGLPEEMVKPAGIMLERNPGVTLLWFARDFVVEQDPNGFLWRFTNNAVQVEWYCRGRAATRAEVLASIESGLPLLQQHASSDAELALLNRWTERAMRLLPRQ